MTGDQGPGTKDQGQTDESPHQEEMPFAIVHGAPITELPKDLYIPPDALEIFLEAFEGPLDLLLYLIKRQNLDILDIPIAQITAQYMEYVDLMKEFHLELAAEYLVMAALLAEIKRHNPPYNTALRDAGRDFGPASEIDALATEHGCPLPRPCPMTDRSLAGVWFGLISGMRASEVSDAFQSVASITEEVSASAEEVSASGEEMSAQVQEVSANAEGLAEMAQKLAMMVARFKVSDDDVDQLSNEIREPEVPDQAEVLEDQFGEAGPAFLEEHGEESAAPVLEVEPVAVSTNGKQ